MVATVPDITAMEEYFNGIGLPKVFKLNAAATINDLPFFIRRTLENVKKPQALIFITRWIQASCM